MPFTFPCHFFFFLSSSHGDWWERDKWLTPHFQWGPFLPKFSALEWDSFPLHIRKSLRASQWARCKVCPQATREKAEIGSWTNSEPWTLGMATCWAVQGEGPRGERANSFQWFPVVFGEANAVFTSVWIFPNCKCIFMTELRTAAQLKQKWPFLYWITNYIHRWSNWGKSMCVV